MALDRDWEMRVEAAMGVGPGQNRDAAIERVRAMLRGVVMSMVDDMDAVRVEVAGGRRKVTLLVKVAEPDLGSVIGRDGKTARTLKHIVDVVAGRNKLVCELDIVKPRIEARHA